MKKLTYGKQIALGVALMTLGHLLSWLTDWRFFENLGWIAYGMLFLIHPVWGAGAANTPRIKTYVRLAGAAIVLMGCVLRTGGGDDFLYDRIEESLGIDVSDAAIVQSYDDHSGFHGDGTIFAAFSFEDNALEERISAPGGWKVLPLTDTLTTLVYGTRTETTATGPFIGITMPKVEEGYYVFHDRLNECDTDDLVLTRGSYNYTIAIYDSLSDTLYYCEYDT